MAFITRDEVKSLLQITGDSRDELIDILLPMVKDDIQTYCNTDIFLNGMKPVSALMINYLMTSNVNTGKQSESIGTYSYQMANAKSGYPDSIYSTLDKYKMVSMKGGSIKPQVHEKRGHGKASLKTDLGEIQSACCAF